MYNKSYQYGNSCTFKSALSKIDQKYYTPFLVYQNFCRFLPPLLVFGTFCICPWKKFIYLEAKNHDKKTGCWEK